VKQSSKTDINENTAQDPSGLTAIATTTNYFGKKIMLLSQRSSPNVATHLLDNYSAKGRAATCRIKAYFSVSSNLDQLIDDSQESGGYSQ
jgi:hypothetical protein